MAKTYRIGVLGLTHDHVWGHLLELASAPNAELAGVADPNQPLLDKVKSDFGCATYRSHEELADNERLDAVYIYSDNAAGAELAVWAAERGLHAMVEKPMAANFAGAERMAAAARESGTRLMINWPFAWWPQLQQAMAMAQAGEIGELWQVKYRAAHQGPKELGCSEYFCEWLFDKERNGAGALMDYCCYGCVLARALLGPPERVIGYVGRLCKDSIDVEDNALIVMSYLRKMATAEASWTQIGKLGSYVTLIYGTKGTLMIEPRGGGKLLLATEDNPDGAEVDTPASAPPLSSASAHFLWAIETGGEIFDLCRPDVSCDAQEILEAGLRSAESGAAVALPL